jgi:hypothetical protein
LENAKKIKLIQSHKGVVGFASFDSRDEYTHAMDVMNNAEFKGRPLMVQTVFGSNNWVYFSGARGAGGTKSIS